MKKEKKYKKGGSFNPHMMYDPNTGRGHKANTVEDHNKMNKMGYTHKKPKAAYGMKMKKYAGGGSFRFQHD